MPVAIDLSPEQQELYRRSHRWSAAIKAGLIGGFIVWLVPGGNPWTAFARPSGAHIMGRSVTHDGSITLFSAQAIEVAIAHLAVSVVCALLLLAVVYRLRSWRALLAGVAGGLLLYVVNFATLRLLAPDLVGSHEFNVALAHVLFGGIAAGVMRGFLRPPQELDTSKPNPGPRMPH